jgi:hypothetical protein
VELFFSFDKPRTGSELVEGAGDADESYNYIIPKAVKIILKYRASCNAITNAVMLWDVTAEKTPQDTNSIRKTSDF